MKHTTKQKSFDRLAYALVAKRVKEQRDRQSLKTRLIITGRAICI